MMGLVRLSSSSCWDDPPVLSVILSAYNAESFIENSVTELSSYLDSAELRYEIIVVNDGSTDHTKQRLHSLISKGLVVCHMPRNQGRGAAIKRGIEVARAKYIVATDADVPYGPESVLQCYKALHTGAHLVVGDRTLSASSYTEKLTLARRLLSGIHRLMTRFVLLRSDIRDTQCGLKGFHSSFAKLVPGHCKANRWAFDLDLIAFALENRVHIDRLPIVLRNNNESTVRVFRDSIDTFLGVCGVVYKRHRGLYRLVDAERDPHG